MSHWYCPVASSSMRKLHVSELCVHICCVDFLNLATGNSKTRKTATRSLADAPAEASFVLVVVLESKSSREPLRYLLKGEVVDAVAAADASDAEKEEDNEKLSLPQLNYDEKDIKKSLSCVAEGHNLDTAAIMLLPIEPVVHEKSQTWAVIAKVLSRYHSQQSSVCTDEAIL